MNMKKTVLNFRGLLPSGKSKKGFITLYMAMILSFTLAISSLANKRIRQYYEFQDDLSYVREINRLEILTINRIKQKLRNFQEEDETLWVGDYSIEIRYDDLDVDFSIAGNGLKRERKFSFDDFNDYVYDYR